MPRSRFARALGPLRGPAGPEGPRHQPTLLGERAFGAPLVERMKRAIVLLALAACGGDDSGGGGGDGGGGGGDAAHMTCLTETNKYRSGAGKAAVAHSDALETYADTGAMFDFNNSPHAHFMQTGGGGIAFAENECPQQLGWTLPAGTDPSSVVAMCIKAFFDEGPGGGHYDNLMGNYAHLGCGIYAASGKITILQDFGN